MEGGIAILLLLIIGGVVVSMMLTGGLGATLAKIAGPKHNDDPRPRHRVAEPEDENAVGYGVSGEHGDEPQPPRVDR